MNTLCHFMQVLICPRSPVMNLSFDPRSQAWYGRSRTPGVWLSTHAGRGCSDRRPG
jgi:hypothetical protein